MKHACNAEEGNHRQQPRSPQHECSLAPVQRQLEALLPASCKQAHHSQWQKPTYLSGELLVQESQRSFLAILANPTRAATARTTARRSVISFRFRRVTVSGTSVEPAVAVYELVTASHEPAQAIVATRQL